jgi:plastocyanin
VTSGRLRARALLAVAVAGVLCLALAGCASQSSVNRRPRTGSATASEVGGVQELTVQTGDDYRFHPSTITVRPGPVRLLLHNGGKGAPHNLTFLSLGAATPLATSGQTVGVNFTAPAPGRYQFVCTIHQRQGQTGTLNVVAG